MHFVIASADLLRDELAVADGDELDLHSPLITVIARKYNQTPVIFSEVYISLYVQSFLIVLCRGVDSCRSLVFFPPAWQSRASRWFRRLLFLRLKIYTKCFTINIQLYVNCRDGKCY